MGEKEETELHEEAAAAEEEEPAISLGASSDICTALLQRYKKSSAPQHRHLCATAAAMRSILVDEGLPLTPPAYFAAAISAFCDAPALDPDATTALSSFLSILLPLIPPQSLPPSKASDAVGVIVQILCSLPETVSAATLRSIIKLLGFLLPLCDVEDWSAVELPLKKLLEFSVDRRPKVRRCAQECAEKIFKSFESHACKRASKMVWSLFKNYMPLAIELSTTRTVGGSKNGILSKPGHLEVLHMLNTLKLIFPFLSKKITSKLLPDLSKLLGSHFSPLTRHILNVFGVIFEFLRADVPLSEVENIIISLASYVSSPEENPIDSVISASVLLKGGLDKLRKAELSIWMRNLPLVFRAVAGFLGTEAESATQVVDILKGLIDHHIDRRIFLGNSDQLNDGGIMGMPESVAMESICAVFLKIMSDCGGTPNEHTLAVVSDLFLKLGDFSYFFMKDIVLKLSEQAMIVGVGEDVPAMNHLQKCIGSAVTAMGPEKILSLIPISFDAKKLTCLNIWLIPILKQYIVGASLNFFLEHIVPLARTIQKACLRVKRSSFPQDLQTCARDLFDLLPSFCRSPTDTSQAFESLVKLLVVLLEESSMHETVSSALQELVNQNKFIVKANQNASESPNKSTDFSLKDARTESESIPSHYSKKIASRNIKALASSSMDLLQVFRDAFFNSPPDKRTHLKEAIGCLASITERSKVKQFFLQSLEKITSTDRLVELGKSESHSLAFANMEQGGQANAEKKEGAQRCLLMELASALIEGADEDFINLIFDYIRPSLQATDDIGHSEAYCTLSRIFEGHPWFYSSRFNELLDVLLGQKSCADVLLLRRRFTCLHFLLVHILKNDMGKMNAKAFLILNEIILTVKDSKKESRNMAYEILLLISCSLKGSQSANTDAPLQRLFSMILGYLSGASPHIVSGAVAALSLLVYKDPSLCFTVPDLLPSVLFLLKNKANEIIKAVLGFIKVVVSCLDAKDLQKFLSDVVNGVLPWLAVSKHHFRSKVRIILEIVLRKCGLDSIDLVTPKKYKGFIKTLAEQRKSKAKSKESGNSDWSKEVAESIPKGGIKRVHEESSIQREKATSKASGIPWGEKRQKKLNTDISSIKESKKYMGRGSNSQRRKESGHSISGKRHKVRSSDGKIQHLGGKIRKGRIKGAKRK